MSERGHARLCRGQKQYGRFPYLREKPLLSEKFLCARRKVICLGCALPKTLQHRGRQGVSLQFEHTAILGC